MRVCPRCQTPAQAGGKVCERCEQPLEGPAHALRYNPAGLPTPSPVQGHATVLVGIVAALVVLAVGAWFFFRGVGPFRAEVVSQFERRRHRRRGRPAGGQRGRAPGRARCRITGLGPDGRLRNSEVRLSPTVPGNGSVRFPLRGDGLGDAHDLRISCA